MNLRACSIKRHMLSISMVSGQNGHRNHTLPLAVVLTENHRGSSACPCGSGGEGAQRLGPSPPEPCCGGGGGGRTAEAAGSRPGQCRFAGGEGYPLCRTDDAGGASEPPLDCNMQWTEIKKTKSKLISPSKINSRVFFPKAYRRRGARRGACRRDSCLSLPLGVHGVGRRRWSVHRKRGEGEEVVEEDEVWL